MMMMNGRSSKYPFTPSQWQELEHQALIYNYMVSGVPVPPDLIHPMRRSFLLESTAFTSPSLAFPPQSSNWGCFQLGFGRKPEDPEPGRCRRTDGKKWRCSKEAYPDSKYCERHMHRGKNRSRKPVEMSLAPAAAAAPAPSGYSSTSSSLATSLYPPPSLSISTPEAYHHLMYPYSPVKKPQHTAPTYYHLDRESYSSSDKDNRYSSAVKDVDGYCFLSDVSGSERESSLQFRPLGMNSFDQSAYSNLTTDRSKERQEEKQQQQHCFVLGADFKLEKPMKVMDAEQETRRPLRHFIDEWPQANRSSWASIEGDHANLSFTKTQLSISTPMAHHNWFLLPPCFTCSSHPWLHLLIF